ncbi:MAG TPA: hypothetical protein VK735_26330, partial [Pseudonocardia sp.]
AGLLAMLPLIASGGWLLETVRPERTIELAVLLGTGLLAVTAYAAVLRVLGRRPAVDKPTVEGG